MADLFDKLKVEETQELHVVDKKATPVRRVNDVGLIDLDSDVADHYLRLQTNISYASLEEEIHCFGVTSSQEAEGKTTTATNLAYVYAEKGFKVLLIDMDLRRPSVHRLLHLENKIGVFDVVKGDAELKDAIQHFKKGNFDVLTPGTHTPFPEKVYSSDEIKDIFAAVKKEYDYVIVDTAPVLVVNDALSIAPLVQGFVVICAQHYSRKKDVKDAIDNMKSKNINILGICMTMCDNYEDSGHGYKYGYSYGYGYGKDNQDK